MNCAATCPEFKVLELEIGLDCRVEAPTAFPVQGTRSPLIVDLKEGECGPKRLLSGKLGFGQSMCTLDVRMQ